MVKITVTKKDLGILFKKQYKPRNDFIVKNLSGAALTKWKNSTLTKKIVVIDNLQRKGFFKKK